MAKYEEEGLVITQIGSLPLTDPKKAVEYSLRHDIPFLPELPLLGEGMLSYIRRPGSLVCLGEFKKHTFTTVKIQAVGPATLILSGFPPDEALIRIWQHIAAILEGLKAEEVILFLDEPALGQVGFDYEELWRALFQDFPVIRGVHVCGNMQWDRLFKSDTIDIISFDASRYDITFYYPRYGKRIAWGITRAEDVRDFRAGDLLTPPCGLAPPKHTPDELDVVLNLLRACAQKFRGR
jgi:hypothetical protein